MSNLSGKKKIAENYNIKWFISSDWKFWVKIKVSKNESKSLHGFLVLLVKILIDYDFIAQFTKKIRKKKLYFIRITNSLSRFHSINY